MLTQVIDDIRGLIGREVTFKVTTLSGCGSCTENPVDNSSTNPYCDECKGVYWIPTLSGVTVSGHVTWGQADELNWRAGGQMFEGDVRIQIKLLDSTLVMLDNTDHIVVDGKIVEIKKKTLRGVPELNRVLLDCIEREKYE